MTFDVAVLPGDGIGPEVVAEAVRVLRRVQELSGGEVALSLETFAAGAGTWRRSGEAIADDVYAACEAADAILLGAAGLPDARHPDGREAGGDVIFRLRFGLDLYAGIRPVRLYAGVPTPLRETAAGIDYVLVRENVEGLYAGRHGGSRVEGQVAADTSIVTRAGTRRIVETAFAVAEHRAAAGRERSPIVTCVDKSNVLASYAFFREVASEVATRHVDVSFEAIYVDAAALYLVQRPATFDVVVTENMFGDILSDLGRHGRRARPRALRRRWGRTRSLPGRPRLRARHRRQRDCEPRRHDPLRRHDARLARPARGRRSRPAGLEVDRGGSRRHAT